METQQSAKQIMSFDIGLLNIGIAVGNTLLKIAHPLTIITEPIKFQLFIKIDIIIKKWLPKLFIIGNGSNTKDETPLQLRIKKFSNKLYNDYNLPIIFINEDFSSIEASAMLNQQQIYGIHQKDKTDDLAACVILQRYFDSL